MNYDFIEQLVDKKTGERIYTQGKFNDLMERYFFSYGKEGIATKKDAQEKAELSASISYVLGSAGMLGFGIASLVAVVMGLPHLIVILTIAVSIMHVLWNIMDFVNEAFLGKKSKTGHSTQEHGGNKKERLAHVVISVQIFLSTVPWIMSLCIWMLYSMHAIGSWSTYFFSTDAIFFGSTLAGVGFIVALFALAILEGVNIKKTSMRIQQLKVCREDMLGLGKEVVEGNVVVITSVIEAEEKNKKRQKKIFWTYVFSASLITGAVVFGVPGLDPISVAIGLVVISALSFAVGYYRHKQLFAKDNTLGDIAQESSDSQPVAYQTLRCDQHDSTVGFGENSEEKVDVKEIDLVDRVNTTEEDDKGEGEKPTM